MRSPVAAGLLWAGWLAVSAQAAGWHHPLYLGNDGYWRKRVPVTVRNETDRAVAGEPVSVRIGRGEGQADLVGALAQAVRVCDAAGVEMLFDITDPDGANVRRGAIPAGASITIPVECKARGSATYYVYFDNASAWAVPDFLEARMGLVNGGVEQGSGGAPAGWRHDTLDAQHKASWASQDPHGGKRCLKTVVAEGAEPTWIATRQSGIHVIGGAKYVLTAWVRGQGVKGYAGWYIHVGNAKDSQLLNRTLQGGQGTFGWKQIREEFTAPAEADTVSVGTVLWGTGTAWFDDVTLECAETTRLTASGARVEDLALRAGPAGDAWYDGGGSWDRRVPVRLANFSNADRGAFLAYVELPRGALRAGAAGAAGRPAFVVTDGRQVVKHFVLPDGLAFEAHVPAKSIRTYYVYLGGGADGSPAGGPAPAAAGYADLLAGKGNLVKNPSFERGQKLPDDWPGAAEGSKPAGTDMALDSPGEFGKRCVRMHVPHGSTPAWTGWRQSVPVQPGRTYLYAGWIKTADVRNGSVQLHAHYRNAEGELCDTKKFAGIDRPLTGTADWTLLSGCFEMPPDIAAFQLHLTMLATGTVWHDGVVLAEVARGLPGVPESRRTGPVSLGLAVWPVNAVVKVFRQDPPPAKAQAAWISTARNEAEPLQLAVRSGQGVPGVRVQVDPPAGPGGHKLADLAVNVVGYVPIDHPTNYYRSESPSWHRKFPTQAGACDGWAGMWPDPLLPRDTFDLTAEATQPIWVTVSVPKDAPPGDYTGAVRLTAGEKLLHRVPFTVHVWGFTLPDVSRVKAIYDLRVGPQWRVPGKSDQEVWRDLCRFMAKRRVCPDTIQPAPQIRYADGRAVADFTEFDKAAEFYFGELKLPHAYTPWSFYLFGWGFPPSGKFGQAPYEGTSPYEGADRGKLRPEFKKAYQACLKAYWDHVKAKGWADKILLYISDEPFYSEAPIRDQMVALCRMIHEVDPAIPIYSSTWHHVPQWDGSLNVWGIGHYGPVPVEQIAKLRAGGARILWTTDGQMCTDTPYCAVERLLPHYCVRYGAEGYEFWGITWLTYDPYEFGWHRYIHQSDQPGKSYYVRYPNGDGFLAYPGAPGGYDGPVSSVRLEQAREGVEDAEYLYMLADLAAKAESAGGDASGARAALAKAAALVTIPNAGGRYSTKILPDPDAVLAVKRAVAEAIEKLKRKD